MSHNVSVFSVQNLAFGSFLYLLFTCGGFLLFIWFKSVFNYSLKHFYLGCFKIMSGNSVISIILVLAFMSFLKFSLRSLFLVLDMLNDFLLKIELYYSESYLIFMF